MDSKEKKKSLIPDSILDIIKLVPSAPDVIHFTNIKTKPEKETLSAKQKAAWLQSQRPEYGQSYTDPDRISMEEEDSNRNIEELMEDIGVKLMSMPFQSYEDLEEHQDQITDVTSIIKEHLDNHGNTTHMLGVLDILSHMEGDLRNEFSRRQQGSRHK